jgi:hypothetical protein
MNGVERLGLYQSVDGAGTRAASAPTVKAQGKTAMKTQKSEVRDEHN